MLISELDFEKLTVFDKVYTSCDLLNWQLKKDSVWGNGTEPLTSVFYNSDFKCHTIIERPFWGVRTVGYKETSDWNRFSDYNYCLKVDSCDEPLSEIYGMYAFSYDGMYIISTVDLKANLMQNTKTESSTHSLPIRMTDDIGKDRCVPLL